VPRDAVNLEDTSIRTWVNGELRQDSNTSQMIFRVPQLVSFLSQGTTLLPGSLILTGTPAGVGYVTQRYLAPGDVVRVQIAGLGELRNTVAADRGAPARVE
jgi:2-keto-4-pentenoate hydratase/2-oxohepta-3-ene-1,7-dioic acid hydratase in catechol pathway